jgi:hypothetical protein
VADGKVAAEGSTNKSVSGQGEFVISGSPGSPGYKAQSVITDPDTMARFTVEPIAGHMAAQHLAVHDPTKVSSLKGPAEGTAAPAKPKKTPAKSGGKS